MRILTLLILLLGSVNIKAQDSIAIAYASSINVEDLQTHLYILASDSLEGRETGKKGQKLAADYISRHFQSIGIPPYNGETYYQEFPLLKQKLEESTLRIYSEVEYLKNYYTLPYFGSVDIEFNEMQCVGFGWDEITCSDYRYIDVKDKVVLILSPDLLTDTKEVENIKLLDWNYQLQKAYDHGAKAVVFVGGDVNKKLNRYAQYFTKEKRSVLIEEPQFKLPFLFVDQSELPNIIGLSIKKLKKKVKKCKYASFNVDGRFTTNVSSSLLQGENVLGYLEGTDLKDELLVITAHYDHIGIHDGEVHNGADDDGSGTVAILELAEAFAKAKAEGNGPRRSILFMPVAGEEMGLLGSSYYTENPVFPLENTIADLNIDMIGRMDENHEGNPDYVYLIGADKLSSELHQISEDANTYYTQLELDYTFNEPNDPNRFYYRSDHYNFAKNNIPVIFYFNGVHADYHKASDTVEKIHFGKISTISKLIFHTAWTLVNQDKRIEVDVESDFKNDRK
jgi:hypothetical protein